MHGHMNVSTDMCQMGTALGTLNFLPKFPVFAGTLQGGFLGSAQ